MSGQWICHDPQVQADSSQPACQTGQSGRPHQELHPVDDMCLRCVVRACRDTFSPGKKYPVLCVRVPAVHSTKPSWATFSSRSAARSSVVNCWCNRNLPSSSRPVGWLFCFFAAPQWDFMLRAADRGCTPGRGKPRRLTSEQRCRREMKPGLVTATTTLQHLIWAFPLLTAGSFLCGPRPAVERLGLITTCHSRHSVQYMSTCLSRFGP